MLPTSFSPCFAGSVFAGSVAGSLSGSSGMPLAGASAPLEVEELELESELELDGAPAGSPGKGNADDVGGCREVPGAEGELA